MFEELVDKPAKWLQADGTDAAIVLSSRIRLARNVADIHYPDRASDEMQAKAKEYVRSALEEKGMLDIGKLYESETIDDLDRNFLIERHLISPEFLRTSTNRALYVRDDESVSIMINEEDHLRIQSFQSGLEIQTAMNNAERTDHELGNKLEYDFSSDYGFLTSCPTNVGTGLRASVLIHLPGLVLTNEIDGVLSQITKVGLAVRGFYGEGSDVLGNIFQVSNQTTLGRKEEDIIGSLEEVTRQLMAHEENARTTLIRDAGEEIKDKIWRAYGILKHARVLSSGEAMNLLSAMRMGVAMGILDMLPLRLINEIMLLVQPAHLQKLLNEELSPSERDSRRAQLVRERLADR
ncbi:MAG: protein arginine kinase [candidate division Zixibacteria bacterium]|nr:protein arginine kinase [candidate division Zixibacteria bacterium]MBU1469191.1 protein arginine kinase [candidate division Zixibacteria bacterium]MBU2626571.1 protein arginine kinase [candidate division Zixibacteria bacterium]